MSGRGFGVAYVVLGALVACDAGEPPECEVEETPTCSSTLVVERTATNDTNFAFVLRNEDEGLDLDIRCPTPEDEEPGQGTISWFCGAGEIRLVRTDDWPDTLEVGFGGSFPTTVTPEWQSGLDLCGNLCRNGMITL